MEPLLGHDDVLREVVVIAQRVDVVGRRLPNDVGAEMAVAALEHDVRVPEVRAGGLGHEGVAEPRKFQSPNLFQNPF